MKTLETVEILKELWRYAKTDKYSETEIREALDRAIEAVEFQDKIIDIYAQVIVDSGCDTLEEFCEKWGINTQEATDDN